MGGIERTGDRKLVDLHLLRALAKAPARSFPIRSYRFSQSVGGPFSRKELREAKPALKPLAQVQTHLVFNWAPCANHVHGWMYVRCRTVVSAVGVACLGLLNAEAKQTTIF